MLPALSRKPCHVPLVGHSSFAPVEALQKRLREINSRAMDRRVIDVDAEFRHHLFQVAQAEAVGKIPVGTKTLRFRLKDHQATGYQHGGGEYPVSGKSVSIPCGALKSKSYEGPSPPAGQVHDYEWIVTAVDASGSVVGTGSALRRFPQ